MLINVEEPEIGSVFVGQAAVNKGGRHGVPMNPPSPPMGGRVEAGLYLWDLIFG